MICEIIGKPGEPGSGAGADAFEPGIGYICEKAGAVLLRNLTSENWRDAVLEMRLTSELSRKVRKPYYHLVLSWHEHEQPSNEQMLAAMAPMLEALGLAEHQAVIGTHHDREHRHVHVVVNTVHPTSGKAWSKSNDQQKAELACRQIELDQGWTADRGRFDVAVDEVNGRQIARLVPKPDEHWESKRAAREKGKRSKTAGQKNRKSGPACRCWMPRCPFHCGRSSQRCWMRRAIGRACILPWVGLGCDTRLSARGPALRSSARRQAVRDSQRPRALARGSRLNAWKPDWGNIKLRLLHIAMT